MHARAKAYSDAMKKVYESYPEITKPPRSTRSRSWPPSRTTTRLSPTEKQRLRSWNHCLSIEPDHPGVAHYLIHAYDKPQLAQLGIAGRAPLCAGRAGIAACAAHAVAYFCAAGIVAGRHQFESRFDRRDSPDGRHMGDYGHQFHAMDFLTYAYMQSGREAEAEAVVEEIKTMPEDRDSMYG